MRDSNPRPPRCKRDALPAELIALNRSLRRVASGIPPSSEADEHRAASAARTPSDEFVAQPFAGFELGLLRRGNLNLFTGAGIAAFRRRPAGHREGAKPDQTDFGALLQRIGNRVEYRIDRLVSRRFRQVRLTGNGINELVSIHVLPPKRDAGWLEEILRGEFRAPPQTGQRRGPAEMRVFSIVPGRCRVPHLSKSGTRPGQPMNINALARPNALRPTRE